MQDMFDLTDDVITYNLDWYNVRQEKIWGVLKLIKIRIHTKRPFHAKLINSCVMIKKFPMISKCSK